MPAPVRWRPSACSIVHPDGELAAAPAAALGRACRWSSAPPRRTTLEDVAAAAATRRGGTSSTGRRDRDRRPVSSSGRGCWYRALVLTLDTSLWGGGRAISRTRFLPFLPARSATRTTSPTRLPPPWRRCVDDDQLPRSSTGPACSANPALDLGRPRLLCGSTGAGRSRSRGSCTPTTPAAPPDAGWTASSSPTTAAARSTAQWLRSTRCPAIVDAVADGSEVLMDSGVRTAPTSSRRWRSAPARCCSSPVRVRARAGGGVRGEAHAPEPPCRARADDRALGSRPARPT